MGIINAYKDVEFVISDLCESDIKRIISGREFAVIQVEPDIIHCDSRKECGNKHNPLTKLGIFNDTDTLQIGDGDEVCGRTYLYIKQQLPLHFRHIDGIRITYPSVKELIPMILGKHLYFSADFAFFPEENCRVESVLNDTIQDCIFALRNEDEYYLYDKLFYVEIFLRKIATTTAEAHTFMRPFDVRKLNINTEILTKLRKEYSQFYDDSLMISYAMESERLQAQYFLSKFHSNREWELDPICILNYRLSSFILPGGISEETAADLPDDKIVYDLKSGTKYMIDSIHVNSDICFNRSEFNKLIERFTYNIKIA